MNNEPETPEEETPEVASETADVSPPKNKASRKRTAKKVEDADSESGASNVEPKVSSEAPTQKLIKFDAGDAPEEKEGAPPKKKRVPRKKAKKAEPTGEGNDDGDRGVPSDEVPPEKAEHKESAEKVGEKKGRGRSSAPKGKRSVDPENENSEDEKARHEQAKKEEEQKQPDIPESIDLNEFQEQSMGELYDLGLELGLRVAGARTKHHIIFEILSFYAKKGSKIRATGILEASGGGGRDSAGFLRWPHFNFAPLPDDVYVSSQLVRQYELAPGQLVSGLLRPPRDRKDKFLALDDVDRIEGVPEEKFDIDAPFDKLTPLFPAERIILENADLKSVSARVVDLVAPLGKGQRGLIVAPPRGGKTILLKEIARAIHANHKEVELIILLLDERPEEVTDFEEAVDSAVYSSTFDETAQRHAQMAELVMLRAQRLVEQKKDVVVLLDSLTRLARGYNNNVSGKGRGVTSGGVSHQALEKSRKFFGAARNVEEGGSLTILATALVETESKMDDVIYEQFKGTGNMEIHLDRELVEKRIFPAIHTLKSGTRKDDLLYHPDEMARVNQIRRQLAQLPVGEAMEVLTKNIRLTGSNAEILLAGLR